MMSVKVWPLTALVAVFFVVAGTVCFAQPIAAITEPSADVGLSFLNAGRIAQLHVKDGDIVKQGQLLIALDDAVEMVQLAQLRATSEDKTQILASQATLEQKQVDLKRIQWAAQRGAATDLELEHARLDVRIAELSLEVARFEHEQAIRKYEAAIISVENMKLKSPISGTVEKVGIEVGESINALEQVIRIVTTDPLWIDAPVPVSRARILKVGQIAQVRYEDGGGESAEAKIIFIATAADAASSTLRVRLEMKNQAKRPSGEHVMLTFAGQIATQGGNDEKSDEIQQ